MNPDALVLMSLKVEERWSDPHIWMSRRPTCVAIITSASSRTNTVILLRSKNRNLRLQSSTWILRLVQKDSFSYNIFTLPGVPIMILSVILDPLATSSPLTAYLIV